MKPQITICSVYHSPATKALLDFNYEFVKEQNPDVVIRTLVADNSPIPLNNNKPYTVIKGVEFPTDVHPFYGAPYHHGRAINNLLPHINTRFVLFLDPDVFLVSPHPLRTIIDLMKKKNLAFFGIPWHPIIHSSKIRYFPATHAFFVDREKIKDGLDFEPQYHRFPQKKPSILPLKMQKAWNLLSLKKRRSIGKSKETGYKVYEQYRHLPYATAVSVIDYTPTLLDKVLPDSLCFMPKRKGSTTPIGFKETGHYDARGREWQEFMLDGAPFCFHVRGGSKKFFEDTEKKISELELILKTF
ncbi:MAG: hypothetical protein Q8Q94_03150 [bacterium]|nr:hypothetical protein [bacterium]MDZ4299409.1 hypothetical protein [Candidatus Sungbacteria bacterium]